ALDRGALPIARGVPREGPRGGAGARGRAARARRRPRPPRRARGTAVGLGPRPRLVIVGGAAPLLPDTPHRSPATAWPASRLRRRSRRSNRTLIDAAPVPLVDLLTRRHPHALV